MQRALSFETSGPKPLQESPRQHTLLQRKSPLPAKKNGPQPVEFVFSVHFPQLSSGQPWLTGHFSLRELLSQAGVLGAFVLCLYCVFCGQKLQLFCPPLLQHGQLLQKLSRTVDDLHAVDLIMDFPGCHIVLPPQGTNGRPEILKISLMFVFSHSQNGWQAIQLYP